ncbi:ornithine carbamoyltransferase [Brevibacterium sp. 50QC2O2]|jgi:ornithine carbamoyltransferase|uniref:ornithine carbamoyltransferase n=1 Tax=Brevibacterium sp. 50QC2O2 TaxID=2968459 RepID=UPI00211CCCD5|nr:ornithine carbamoyltransferase [Brevibacterium sp. 50QC2O2]MCQ9387921.1 ornithine carbamoyltransferase [Brevibacterium sp. 50QC2O2]
MTRHFLKDTDLSPAELVEVLDLAQAMKADPYAFKPLAGPQTVAIIFDKTSTRTRVSFAAGVAALGGNPLIINPGESQLGHKESIEDSAQVFSRMVSAMVWRTYEQSGLERMAASGSVPVINALSDDYHPCQLLADLLTIREHRGNDSASGVAGLTLSYYGDGANNMAHSYALAGVNAGMHVRIAAPTGHQPAASVVAEAQELARVTGGSLMITDDPVAAAQDADVLVTDTWVSMGQDHAGRDDEDSPFTKYQVTEELMALGHEPIFLHCLPAYRGKEVAAEVIDGPASVVFDEAENRLHAQKALLAWLVERA